MVPRPAQVEDQLLELPEGLGKDGAYRETSDCLHATSRYALRGHGRDGGDHTVTSRTDPPGGGGNPRNPFPTGARVPSQAAVTWVGPLVAADRLPKLDLPKTGAARPGPAIGRAAHHRRVIGRARKSFEATRR
ncbi:hypothetical protein GCM10010177_00010 [Actinomadura citrea]|nr:hypothetical protein GCM10010177_00010 [Actinomadura citrea]